MSRVRFGDIVTDVKNKVDRSNNPYEFYVAGDHMDTEDLEIHRKGKFATDDVGPAFIREFKVGQVLYGSRRTYLKKVAVADFDGITANTTFVLETSDEKKFLQELLPFVMLSEGFTQWSIMKSKGSTNPYVLFSDLADYKFELPDIDKQRELAKVLWAMDATKKSYQKLLLKTDELVKSQFIEMTENDVAVPQIELGKLFDISSGGTPSRSKSEYWKNGTIPWVKISDMKSMYLSETKECITDLGLTKSSAKIYSKGTFLISIFATLGEVSILNIDATTNQAIAGMTPKRDIDIEYTYIALFLLKEKIIEIGRGAAQNNINLSILKKMTIAMPDKAIRRKFSEFVRQSDKSKIELELALAELTATYKKIISENLG